MFTLFSTSRWTVLILIFAALAACQPPDGSGTSDTFGGDTDTTADLSDTTTPPEDILDPESIWSWCPSAADFQGQGNIPLTVTNDALLCTQYSESRLWSDERLSKGWMRLIEGNYTLPEEAGTYAYHLPLCLYQPRLGRMLASGGVGELTVDYPITGSRQFRIVQPVVDTDGTTYHVTLRAFDNNKAPNTPITLDAYRSPSNAEHAFLAYLCDESDPGCTYSNTLTPQLSSCHHEDVLEHRYVITHERGDIEMNIRYGAGGGTPLGVFYAARGTLDGQSFEQTRLEQLIYAPKRHHFDLYMSAHFDAPIGSVCAVKLEGLEIYPETSPTLGRLVLLDCEHNEVAAPQVTNLDLSHTPPGH